MVPLTTTSLRGHSCAAASGAIVPGRVGEVDPSASGWCEDHGHLAEAIETRHGAGPRPRGAPDRGGRGRGGGAWQGDTRCAGWRRCPQKPSACGPGLCRGRGGPDDNRPAGDAEPLLKEAERAAGGYREGRTAGSVGVRLGCPVLARTPPGTRPKPWKLPGGPLVLPGGEAPLATTPPSALGTRSGPPVIWRRRARPTRMPPR